MKKDRVVKKYIYTGLGFPVEIPNVTLVALDGEYIPKIDVVKISDLVIKKLIVQKERLTGNQVRFIRSYFAMPLREFAREAVHVSHSAVNKWERRCDQVTNMDINIEKILRMYMYEKVCVTTKKSQHEFYGIYMQLKLMYEKKPAPLLQLADAA
jgi:DNA-binding transcriptional regulator YiaG